MLITPHNHAKITQKSRLITQKSRLITQKSR